MDAEPHVTLVCGADFVPAQNDVLVVTAVFPAVVSSSQGVVTGEVTVRADAGPVSGVVTPYAEAFLVRDGRVVTLPVPQDSVGLPLHVAVDTTARLPAVVSLTACADDAPLPPGVFQLYARVVLHHDDGTCTDCLGGPFTLEIG